MEICINLFMTILFTQLIVLVLDKGNIDHYYNGALYVHSCKELEYSTVPPKFGFKKTKKLQKGKNPLKITLILIYLQFLLY